MDTYYLYDAEYSNHLKKRLKQTKYSIAILSLFLVAYTVVSLIMSHTESYQWLLYLNIPFDIIGIIVLLVLIQVFLPTFRWEYQMVERATNVEPKCLQGVLVEIGDLPTTYDNQRMTSLIVSANGTNTEIFVRPWHYIEPLLEGQEYTFSLISRVVIAYLEEPEL